jgi:hypothetical protein
MRMGRTIDELMNSMSSAEFSIWLELYEEDQWGEARDDFRTGQICATVANFAGKTLKENSAGLRPADFMPNLRTAPVVEAEVDPVIFFTAVAASKTFNK